MSSTDSAKNDGSYSNPRGIPQAPFVEKVEDYVKSLDDVESVLSSFQEMIQKYKFMEASKQSSATSLKQKIPEIKRTLEMVKFLDSKKNTDEEITTNYELNDTLYTTATVKPTKTVYLWLGANVMLEYPIEEALELLTNKIEAAEKSLKNAQEDLEFLRENITTMEVNTARIYNWDVQKRREQREAEMAAQSITT